MFIRGVDEAFEKLLRARLPLPEDVGDISFEPPTGTWSAQLSRLTVNLFLYQVDRSNQPPRTPTVRVGADGKPERRPPQPMIELSYMLSAWAGSSRDEHQLLGDLASLMAGCSAIPAEYLPDGIESTVLLQFGADDNIRPRDIWGGLNGQLKACYLLKATVATDTWDWVDQAPAVARIAALTSPIPRRG